MANQTFETDYVTRCQDEASAVLKNLDQNWQNLGSDVKNAVAGANVAVDEHGKKLSALTQFYRDHRSEQRMISFYMRDTREAMLAGMFAMQALSGSFGQGTGSASVLNKALIESTGTFIGLHFALSALGVAGPLGVTIAGVGALATAYFSLQEAAKKAGEELIASNEQLAKVREHLGMGSRAETQSAMEKQLESLKKQVEEMKKGTIWDDITDLGKKLVGFWSGGPWGGTAAEIGISQGQSAATNKGTVNILEQGEAIRKHRLEMENAIDTAQRWRSVIDQQNASMDAQNGQFASLERSIVGWDNHLARQHTSIEQLARDWKNSVAGAQQYVVWSEAAIAAGERHGNLVNFHQPTDPKDQKDQYSQMAHIAPMVTKYLQDARREQELISKYGTDYVSALKKAEFAVKSLGGGLEQMWQGVNDGFIKIWDKTLGEANSLFEMFLQGIMSSALKALEELATKSIISGILNLFTGGAAGILDTAITGPEGFGGGGSLVPAPAGPTGGGGGHTTIQIQALDARGVMQFFQKTDNRRALVEAIKSAVTMQKA